MDKQEAKERLNKLREQQALNISMDLYDISLEDDIEALKQEIREEISK